jgi:hypothetical protein
MPDTEPAVLETQGVPPAAPAGPRQFDFWLGDWDVTWAGASPEAGEQHGRNRVEAILDGRVVLENFDGRPSAPLQGLSVSVYNAALAQWRQTWVDNTGNYWAFAGRFAEGRMILSTMVERDGRPIHLRMVWFNLAPDSLDWHWERSSDGGQTWTVLWALHYTRRQP